MMNRRQFVGSTAAAALLAGAPRAFAATYDLVIKGGRVIDPSMGLDATRDIAIAGGRIAAIEASIAADAAETIDARGKIVTAGLIDIHTHAGRSKEGPPMCLQDGVTGWVDCGSAGADNIDQIAARPRPRQHLAHRQRRRRRTDGHQSRRHRFGARCHCTPSRCRDRPQGAIDEQHCRHQRP